MAKLPFPDANAPLADLKTGAPTPPWYRVFDLLFKRFSDAESDIDALPAASQAFGTSVLIEVPDDKTYVIIGKAPFAFTITEVTTITSTGTCTVTVEIDGVALGGTANSASTSEQSQVHSTDNDVAAGAQVSIVVSSNASAEDLTVDIKGTVTLAT